MKIVFMLLLACSLVMAITAEDAAWVLNAKPSLSKALQKAKKAQKKMVLLVIVKDGCSWCEKMIHNTLSSKKVKEALSDSVLAVVDLYTSLPNGMHAEFTPTMFFIDAKTGKVIQKNIGYEEPGGFIIDIVSAKEKLP